MDIWKKKGREHRSEFSLQEIRDREKQKSEERRERILRSLENGHGAQSQTEQLYRRQCTILGLIVFLLAALLILREAGENAQKSHPVQNRIMTAAESILDRTAGEAEIPEDSAGDQLILVNKDHALPEDYEVELHWLKNGRVAVADEIYDSLSAMLTDGTEEGLEFVVASGYRSYEYQQQLLEEDVQAAMEKYGLSWQEAYDLESRETMPEGHSEHETGLAVDIVALDYQMLDGAQEYTEENQWLREHCHEYGFILRYPRGKEDVTGISYESWHFRYVGPKAAREITERRLTLEEYVN